MAGLNSIVEIHSSEEFHSFERANLGCLIVVHFTAKWAAHCQQVSEILKELMRKLESHKSKACFAEIEAEKVPSISQKFNILAVPTCILLKDGREVTRIDGVNAIELCRQIQEQVSGISQNEAEDLNFILKSLISQEPVMLFMKGTPEAPKCGFSKTLVNLLNEQNVQFGSFDILSNETVRQGLKEYSNWPTYPQLYINSELVGGLDIVKELIASGELSTMLPLGRIENKENKLKELINQENVMLFMKGSPMAPQCGFSKSIVQLLNSRSIKYGYFDILKDEEVRQELKTYSNWPTYPQLYINGELVGGLDIVKELDESGELKKMVAASP